MNLTLHYLLISQNLNHGSFFTSKRGLKLIDSRFSRVFSGIAIGNYNCFVSSKSSFDRILGSCFVFKNSYILDTTTISGVRKNILIADSIFHDFPYGTFNSIISVDDYSESIELVRSKLYNINTNPSSTICLINAIRCFSCMIQHCCFFSCSLGYPSYGCSSHINNNLFCSVNYTYEYKILHLGSSWFGGRNRTTFYNNNGSYLTSHGNMRSALAVASTNNGKIGAFSIYKSNYGWYIGLFNTGNSVLELSDFYFVNNTATTALFDFYTSTIATLRNSSFIQNSNISFVAGQSISTSMLFLSQIYIDQSSITSHSRLSTTNIIITSNLDPPFIINMDVCDQAQTITLPLCMTIQNINMQRTFLTLLSFILND